MAIWKVWLETWKLSKLIIGLLYNVIFWIKLQSDSKPNSFWWNLNLCIKHILIGCWLGTDSIKFYSGSCVIRLNWNRFYSILFLSLGGCWQSMTFTLKSGVPCIRMQWRKQWQIAFDKCQDNPDILLKL